MVMKYKCTNLVIKSLRYYQLKSGTKPIFKFESKYNFFYLGLSQLPKYLL